MTWEGSGAIPGLWIPAAPISVLGVALLAGAACCSLETFPALPPPCLHTFLYHMGQEVMQLQFFGMSDVSHISVPKAGRLHGEYARPPGPPVGDC